MIPERAEPLGPPPGPWPGPRPSTPWANDRRHVTETLASVSAPHALRGGLRDQQHGQARPGLGHLLPRPPRHGPVHETITSPTAQGQWSETFTPREVPHVGTCSGRHSHRAVRLMSPATARCTRTYIAALCTLRLGPAAKLWPVGKVRSGIHRSRPAAKGKHERQARSGSGRQPDSGPLAKSAPLVHVSALPHADTATSCVHWQSPLRHPSLPACCERQARSPRPPSVLGQSSSAAR